MRKLVTFLLLILLTTLAMAQRSEGTGTANAAGRNLEGKLPRLTIKGLVDGQVVVSIKIDRSGSVTEATPFSEESTITNEGVVAAVRSVALRAHFNANASAQALQSGTVTYSFVSTGKEQTDDRALKFMGIPVDGSKAEMIAALKNKGFKKESYQDYLEGIFNGEDVDVFISTNHEVVDRIRVVSPYYGSEDDTRVKYNNLLSRFNRNAKYVSLSQKTEIPVGEDIYRSLHKNSKKYDVAYFYLMPEVKKDEWRNEFLATYKKKYTKPLGDLSYDELEEVLFCLPMKIHSAISGIVWFTLGDSHHIVINYDNLQNRPCGEDL